MRGRVDSRFRGNDEMRVGAWDAAGGHRDPPLRLRAGCGFPRAGTGTRPYDMVRRPAPDAMRRDRACPRLDRGALCLSALCLSVLCVILFCVALSGCAASPEIIRSPDVPAEVARQALDDLMLEVSKRFPPAKTPLAIHDNDPGNRLEPVLRAAGYAVHQTGDINPVTFSTHYLRESAMYLGVIRVGLGYTLSRLYIFEGGELQVHSTSLSDEASSTEITGDSNRD